jgi:GcrA cell cycle regulator
MLGCLHWTAFCKSYNFADGKGNLMPPPLWSPDEISRLIALWPILSAGQIGRRLCKTRNAVIGKVHRLRTAGEIKKDKPPLVAKLWRAEQIDKLIELWPTMSARQIAVELHMSRRLVVDKAHQLRAQGLLKRRPKLRKQNGRHYVWQPKPEPPWPPSSAIMCPCSLVELQSHQCKWPFGDPRQHDFYFCGAVRFAEGPYCRRHSLMARGGKD